VVCAVMCEPVSTTNSRLLGNLIGNLGLLSGFRRVRDEILWRTEILMLKFPVLHNRELRTTYRESKDSKRVLDMGLLLFDLALHHRRLFDRRASALQTLSGHEQPGKARFSVFLRRSS